MLAAGLSGALAGAQEPAPTVSLLDAMILGLVEGLTEFLPVSSTGHLIVAGHLLDAHSPTLEVGIQIGAISAILVLFWPRLWQALRSLRRPSDGSSNNLLLLLVVAALPAAIVGKLADDWIEARLFSPVVVGWSTLLGGLLLLWLERWLRARPVAAGEITGMTWRTALWIGVWQCLALVPGTSRSGATIAGGLLLGLSRPAAAEFSFLVGLPILYGACALKLKDHWQEVSGPLRMPFLVALVFAFLSALVVVRPFVRFLRAHTFVPFAVYRIVAGAVLLLLCARGVL